MSEQAGDIHETAEEPEFRWFALLLLAPLYLPILGGTLAVPPILAFMVLPGFDHALHVDATAGLILAALSAVAALTAGWTWFRAARAAWRMARGASAFPLLAALAIHLVQLAGWFWLFARLFGTVRPPHA